MLRIQIFAPLIGSISESFQHVVKISIPPPTSHEIVTAFGNGVVL
jgi:hypothetical protein